VLTELYRGVQVCGWLKAAGSMGGSISSGSTTVESGFGGSGSNWGRAHVHKTNTGGAVAFPSSNTNDRPILRTTVELLERPASTVILGTRISVSNSSSANDVVRKPRKKSVGAYPDGGDLIRFLTPTS
jgi:hypothetical protein